MALFSLGTIFTHQTARSQRLPSRAAEYLDALRDGHAEADATFVAYRDRLLQKIGDM